MPSHFKCYWTAFVLGVGIFFMSNEIEIWKVIDGYEDYQVSSFGNVKSTKKFNGTNERLLKKHMSVYGYLMANFIKNGKQKNFTIHVLVAMMFLGHKPDGTRKIVVDHKDNNKLNNHVDNLQLISTRENCSKDRKGYSSKYVGVSWNKVSGKWKAGIYYSGREIRLGLFELEIDAANAYQKALKELNNGLDLNILYPKRVNTSKYKWVIFDNKAGKWKAVFKWKYLGLFKTELEAHEAVQNYIKQLKNENK